MKKSITCTACRHIHEDKQCNVPIKVMPYVEICQCRLGNGPADLQAKCSRLGDVTVRVGDHNLMSIVSTRGIRGLRRSVLP